MAILETYASVKGNIRYYQCLSTDSSVNYPTIALCGIGSRMYVLNATTNFVEKTLYFDGTNWVTKELNADLINFAQAGTRVKTQVTRPSNIIAYTALDVVGLSPAANNTFSNVSNVAGQLVMLTGIRFAMWMTAVPANLDGFYIHLFDSAPTAIADADPFTIITADRSKYLGRITIGKPEDLGDLLWYQEDGLNMSLRLDPTSKNLYFVIQTIGGYTPESASIIEVTAFFTGY